MDYLIHDAKNTGSKYGQYEVDYLIECMHLEKKGNDLILCIKEKGIHTLKILTSKRDPNKNEIVLLNKNLSTIISQIEGVTTYFIRVYS